MNKTVLVTGGSRGIGAAISRKLAKDGYRVAINYIGRRDAAEAMVDRIRASGGEALAFRADVADPADVLRLFAEVQAAFGPLAALVSNAGILGDLARLDEADPDALARLLSVNIAGPLLCARAAVRAMSSRHGGAGGAIVTLSSVAATWGGAGGLVAYAASKGAVNSLTLGLAREVAAEGIRVNAVAPGLIDTDMNSAERKAMVAREIPMGRIGTAGEVAEAVAWLLSPAASYVTGTVLTVAGGR